MTGTSWAELMQQAKGQLELIPDGDANVKIIDSQATTASTGKLMFVVKTEIIDGPNVKRKLTTNIVMSDDNPMALAIFFRNMEHIGIGVDFFAQEPTPDQVASAMIGRVARVKIGHKNWNGVDRNEIKAWLPPLDGGGLPGAGGPVAPGTVVGPAGPPLPTSSSSLPTSPAGPAVPTSQPGPVAPTDAPPPLPI